MVDVQPGWIRYPHNGTDGDLKAMPALRLRERENLLTVETRMALQNCSLGGFYIVPSDDLSSPAFQVLVNRKKAFHCAKDLLDSAASIQSGINLLPVPALCLVLAQCDNREAFPKRFEFYTHAATDLRGQTIRPQASF